MTKPTAGPGSAQMRDYDGKTAEERVAERRARLIEAGFKLFGEHGYAGTSIRAVLREAGLRDRYFSESFADLDELLAAVYDQLIDDELAECRAAIAATPGGAAGARAMIDRITRTFAADPGRGRIKLREVLSGGPISQSRRQIRHYEVGKLVADLLPATQIVGAQDRLLLGLGIVAAAEELMLAWLDGGRRLSRRRVVDLVALMFESLAIRLTAGAGN
jgi:AcrR family transcriptional regulator